ncbi:hypothetical protein DITRI_Ditri09bG0139800 [Diplodiscus trichospermus]
MGDRPSDGSSTSLLHSSLLEDAFGSEFTTKTVIHSYKRSFNGFVVDLTEEEAQKIAGMNSVVSVFLNEKKRLHTTKTWDFMGFSQQVERASLESDVIIGILDSGIWPESESFDDRGLGPPPSKWKGSCKVAAAANFTCNNKIIGGKYYRRDGIFDTNDIISPRDNDGHGTHIASIAAGKLVDGASLYGFGLGTARGGVPYARIAVYKVCWSDGCLAADILAAFDDAISDGVDIISISVGGLAASDYFSDPIAIGAFHAMKEGVLTVTSAGNEGPERSSISNVSPWSLSVAASTIDRKFFTKVKLGNSQIYEGTSINTFDLKKKMYPLIYGGDAPNSTTSSGSISSLCLLDSLDRNLVKGKIVLCDAPIIGRGPLFAGAAGMVTREFGANDYAELLALPGSFLDIVDGNKIFQYINTTRSPAATIFKSNEANDTLAPYVVSFSSRGPNPITPDILKPDISAPGVNILAAWSPISPVSSVEGDKRFLKFNMLSGTSMASPHVSAAAAYVKSFHPTWSPSAIKSALMTTATPMSSGINLDSEFAYGSGNLNPTTAVNPGLLYDSEEADYIKFLCGQGYGTRFLQFVTKDNAACSKATNGTVWDLNYPSFALYTSPWKNISQTFNRTVTSVGSPMSVYRAKVTAPAGPLKIQVNPDTLSFTSLGQKLPFVLTIEGKTDKAIVSASLEWDDGVHKVRSPIIVYISIS